MKLNNWVNKVSRISKLIFQKKWKFEKNFVEQSQIYSRNICQPTFLHSSCEPFTKINEKVTKFEKKVDSRYIP